MTARRATSVGEAVAGCDLARFRTVWEVEVTVGTKGGETMMTLFLKVCIEDFGPAEESKAERKRECGQLRLSAS